MRTVSALFLLLAAAFPSAAQDIQALPGTQPFTQRGDISAQMVEGIGRWLDRETLRMTEARHHEWQQAAAGSSWESFVAGKREELKQMIGAVDPRKRGAIEETLIAGEELPPPSADGVIVRRVRWPVFEGVYGEGLLFRPAGEPKAAVIVVPDADQAPESSIIARRIASQGCLAVVPVLVDRRDNWSGNDAVNRYTNQPHREWIYRQSFELGRTIIGYEVQKILAAADALTAPGEKMLPRNCPIGIAGYGEGGLLALHCGALDPRFTAVLVSGYFGPREQLFEEPIYRNLFGYLRDFGDAELAAMIAPRRLIVEYSRSPEVTGPPVPGPGRSGAAPGVIRTPEFAAVRDEVMRTCVPLSAQPISLVSIGDGKCVARESEGSARGLLKALGVAASVSAVIPESPPVPASQEFIDERQERTVRELERFSQRLLHAQERVRNEAVWAELKPEAAWEKARRELQTRLWEQCIGKLTAERLPPNPQTRKIREEPKWIGYEVRLDVLPDIFAWGWLLVPRDLKPGEKRPVVVCQHGLEGLPEDTVTAARPAYGYYKSFAARLADEGFIVYAPHNPYRGGDQFRILQRKANPLGLSLFSFIIAQHDVTTQWLASLPFVDPKRIAFYGLSYGGKTALRVPAMIDRYCLSICSGDFNEWIYKVIGTDYRDSYMFNGEYEMSEWNLAAVANHSEMAMLIAPRPFMVERGHADRCGTDELVGYEFAKVRRGYTALGISERAEIEWFDGPHTIHGAGTFEFLRKHLAWPPPN